MANTLLQDYDLARDPDLLRRVEIAIINAAIAINNEANTVPGHTIRAAYAKQVVQQPAVYAVSFAGGVVSDGLTDQTASDASLQVRINSLWNTYAGVIL